MMILSSVRRPFSERKMLSAFGTRTIQRATICASSSPPPRKRLARYILETPKRVDRYFFERPTRRWSSRFLSMGIGFFCGNTVTLTFGTLSINDVIAAVLTVLFYIGISRWYWGSKKRTFGMELANHFKNGVVIALISDAFKLGG